MRSRFNSLLTISLMLFLTSCTRLLFDDEELSMKRTNYIGEELMTDGYYITGENLGITFFLYKTEFFCKDLPLT